MKTDKLVKTIEALYNNSPHSTVGYLTGMLKGLESGNHKYKSATEYIEFHINQLKKEIAAKKMVVRILRIHPLKKAHNNMNKKLYLAIIPSASMGGSSSYKLIQENEIKKIKYYGEYVNLYELSSDKPISKEKAKKLGLKYEN